MQKHMQLLWKCACCCAVGSKLASLILELLCNPITSSVVVVAAAAAAVAVATTSLFERREELLNF